MSELILKSVGKIYRGGSYAVKDFNLHIRDREFIVLVGPSGCGKSTVLRMIAGLEEITEGDFWIDGRYCNDVEPQHRDVAMVFQNYALYPHMTVYDNMAFSMKIRRLPKAEIRERVVKAAELLGIDHLLERKPRQLSGGQRQRVAIGGAIVRRPKAFLMDEPLSNLDAKLRNQMRIELARLHEELEATIIYVTHDQVEAMTLGSRIVVMKDGVIQQVGTPMEIYRKPENLFVATFIGSPEMNLFHVEAASLDGAPALRLGSTLLPLKGPLAQALESRSGPLIMGVRPENLHCSHQTVPSEAHWVQDGQPLEVLVREVLGSEVVLHGIRDGADVALRVSPAESVEPGEFLNLVFDMDRIHLFDETTGINLLSGVGESHD